ncbi:ATP-dependent helicase [Salinibacter ruber]|uniref:ATP-dependent helicase n=1 Tax=Salinibacter ruber TaxID=146919 RepID=UPI00216A64E8|nr:ATP-dependent helicase [Salinibacter ruber]MCS4099923.1 hypothetical protein [Salinibacter ruber]
MAECYPPPSDWADLRVDLTDGERGLAQKLTDRLSEEWRLYLQPHVGGTRPDLALVHPGAGIQLIEVKDYDLGAYNWSGTDWQVHSGDGLQTTRSPFDQVDEARDALFRLLLPFAEEARQDDPSRYGFVRASVYMTYASESELISIEDFMERALGPGARHYGLGSRASLRQEGLGPLIPLLTRVEDGNPHAEAIQQRAEAIGLGRPWHEIIHDWLHPTPDETLQNEPLELTPSQRQAATHEARRLLVTGPAGSGKTLALARRAAQALLKGEDVLVLGFNITLWHYVQDYVKRGLCAALLQEGVEEPMRTKRFQDALRGLTITHYHKVAYRMWAALGYDKEEVEPEQIARLLAEEAGALEALARTDDSSIPRANTLLVDEGQDWGPRWLDSLRPLLRESPSINVAADPAQRIYDHAVPNPEAVFSGSPATVELNGTARVPAALLPALNTATSRWLGEVGSATELETAPQLSIGFADRPNPEAIWTTVSGPRQGQMPSHGKLNRSLVAASRAHMSQGANLSQIAALVPTHERGCNLETLFEDAGIATCSLCAENPEENRSPKHAFWRLDSRLKLSTVHSFKGWEADVVIVLISELPPSETERETLHVALTRTRAVVEVLAPPGGEDLPAWTHRTGQSLFSKVPNFGGAQP